MNERGPCNLVDWPCVNKENKSMRTLRGNERGPYNLSFVLGVTQGNEDAV